MIYEVQDVEPEFSGGFEAMLVWVQESLVNKVYSAEESACLSYIFMEFVVEKDGSLTNVKARNKCDIDLSHFEKLFRESPKWTPGQKKGKIIRSRYRLPLEIHLD